MRLPIEAQHEVNKIRNSVQADPERLRTYIARMVDNWPAKYPAAAGAVRANAAGVTVLPVTASASRVPLLDPATAPRASTQFMMAAQRLLGGLPNSVRVWAHTPHVAKFFVPFFFAFERDGAGSVLPATLRMMVLLKTHHLHAAQYLIAHHTILGRAAGLTDEQLAALADVRAQQSREFAPREQAAIAWAAQVAHNNAKRDEAVFDELKKHFNDTEVVELTGLCAIGSNADLIYNALRVPLESLSTISALNSEVALDAASIKAYLQSVLADWPQEWPQLDVGAAR